MRRFGLLLLALLMVVPSWAEKKFTVQQLSDLLETMQQKKKSDAEIASELKQISLSEQLPRAAMNALVKGSSGPHTMEQIYVLEAKSALLPPPASDAIVRPTPDASQQKAILDKAAAFVKSTYNALPPLRALRTTLRFQDNLTAIDSSSGLQGSSKDATMGSVNTDPNNQYVRFIHSTQTPVEFAGGSQKPLPRDHSALWGQNGMITVNSPEPSLGKAFSDAVTSASFAFARWEAVNGRPVAVFTFAADKKKSRLPIDICCFPTVSQAGIARFYSPTLGPSAGLSGGGAVGNMQINTQWHDYKKSVPYRGTVYIDPENGIVMRLVTEAEFGSSEYVRLLNERTDFAPVKAGNRTLIAPVKTIIQSEVVPQGDSGVGGNTIRHTYLVSEYTNYAIQ